MNKHVKTTLLVGSGSVGGFILGALFVGKMVLDSDCLREALAKKMVNDIFGEPKRYGQRVTYNSYYNGRASNASKYENIRSKRVFDWSKEEKIIFATSKEANDVLDQMLVVMNDYGSVSVADYKDLCNIDVKTVYTDNGYGWTPEILNHMDPSCSMVDHIQGGYTIKLPDPIKLK